MQEIRIIPCMDLKNGRVVKGVKFVDLIDAGDPVAIAKSYNKQGADEVAFLDISATLEGRKTMLDVIKNASSQVSIPITVGGGISTVNDFEAVLKNGASKVSINSAAVKTPELIEQVAKKFGKQSVMVAIDVAKNNSGIYEVVVSGGTLNTGINAVDWAREVEKLGAGEILLTSMDADGTKDGYAIEITKHIVDAVNIPVIASGGAGKLDDFYEVISKCGVSAVLAASLFHFGEITVKGLKDYLKSKGIKVRE